MTPFPWSSFAILAALILLVIPVFHIIGQWAGYRVLKGDNYRYPVIGKLVEGQLHKPYTVQELAPASSGELSDSEKDIS